MKNQQSAGIDTTQQSALRGRRVSYDNSTMNRDLSGTKGPRSTCISDTEQIAPISMCLDIQQLALRGKRMSNDNSTISRDLSGAKGSRSTCISDTEQITPISMYNNVHQ
eukprot:6104878-Ditylum_brightwellii.AAC.1